MPQEETGSWWGLSTVLKQSAEEFREYVSRPPQACPRDGEPLTPGPSTPAGASVELFCRYCFWQYPRDYVAPERPGVL